MDHGFSPDEVLKTAADAGQLVLEAGGETYRAEETVTEFLEAYGAGSPEGFAMPTGLMISFEDEDGKHRGLVRRIKTRRMNLEKITLVHDLVSKIRPLGLTLAESRLRLQAISSLREYPKIVTTVAAAVGGGFFTFLFGGIPLDALSAGVISAILHVSLSWLSRNRFSDFFINIVGGAITAVLAIALSRAGLNPNADKATIGAIMLLVPGVLITNAIRDTITGDLVAGVSRGADAFTAALGISIGAGIALSAVQALGGGI